MRFPNDLDPDGPDLTLSQIATKLEVSGRTVRRWIQAGAFQGHIYRAGRLKVPQAAVIEYIRTTIK
jgi:predicted site-specific integrase-resolvase